MKKKDIKDPKRTIASPSESKPYPTFENRFGYLNKPRTDDTYKSFTYLRKHICPERQLSSPADLVHNPIVLKHKEIEAFKPNIPTPEPNIYLPSILTECDLLKLINAEDVQSVKKIFDNILVKQFSNEQPRQVLTDLLSNIFVFCRHEKFSNLCTDTLIKLFYYTHKYLISSLSRNANEVYLYFKKLIILHSVLCPPRCARIFSPYEGQKSLLLFCKLYLRHLPLIRVLCVPIHKLEMNPQNYPNHPLLIEK